METEREMGDIPGGRCGPTRWGNQLNGNFHRQRLTCGAYLGPTRWGNQLNGNNITHFNALSEFHGPTRWGNQLNGNDRLCFLDGFLVGGPTRWGNQLNGNSLYTLAELIPSLRPHSLGQPIEWKPSKYSIFLCHDLAAPLAGATN